MQRVHRLSRREVKTILHYTGDVCMLLGAAMLVPILVSFIYNEPRYIVPFLSSAAISAVIGFTFVKLFKIETQITLKSAMVFSTIIWLIACALGALPYYISGELSYLNSYFEAMSGFTTTGFSMYSNLNAVSFTMNFWRAFTQWIGGLGIIFLLLALLRSTGADVMRLYLAEGREERLRPSIKHSTRVIVYIYVFFTALGIILFLIAGMPLFDSVFYTFTALSTGGFGMQNTSILFYNSVWIEIAAMILMMIGATNFALHYTVLKGNWKEYFRDIETKVAFSLIILSTILVTFVLYSHQVYGNDLLLNFRFALFQMVSAISTTGLQTAFYPDILSKWIGLGTFLMTIIMIIGAGSLSTGGGIKWLRLGVLLKGISWQVKSFILPGKAVMAKKIHHVTELKVTDDVLRITGAFVFTYLVIYIISIVIVLIYYNDISRVIFEVASALSNVGLSSGIITPDSPVLVKLVFIIDFWVGRLEIWPVLLLIAIAINNVVRR
ncbi:MULTISPECIES: TrkH family potassium uptake protein [Methanobacterium]|uniref:TrkH family potassium uptake protein n=1 Tax=Methanobacterium veterum TaxID=408577 RepID=A0A9E5A244_9EURY|nr:MULTISPECIES: TrkH family potassium uptake protein [Methanobacterium]MCZ3365471.1 TrkH family potassium uptake protein [Methanobacterium veterum]MCZ3373222.1 TrkH family potassium uptake protein [Methanobacterium veterum]